MSTGLLSTSISNLNGMITQINAINPLPPSALPVRNSAAQELTTDIASIQNGQRDILAFTPIALQSLQTVQQELDQKKPSPKIADELASVSKAATKLKTQIDALNSKINVSKTNIIHLENQLSTIKNHLNQQITVLQTQLHSEQQRIAATRKNYLYLLALGPFGLIGLAAAGIAIGVQEGQINGIQSQISSQNAQIAQIRMLEAGLSHLSQTFSSTVNQISSVRNSVNFVAGDFTSLINDLNAGKTTDQLKLFVITSISQTTTLQNDAS